MDDQMFIPGLEPPEAKEVEYIKSIMPYLKDAIEAQGGNTDSLSYKSNKSGYSVVTFGKQTIFRLQLRGKQNYISVPAGLGDLIPDAFPKKKQKHGDKYICVEFFPDSDNNYLPFLCLLVSASINRYTKEWDCCSRYLECSNAKKCIHPDKIFALACGYRKILNSGKIFYGENRNI